VNTGPDDVEMAVLPRSDLVLFEDEEEAGELVPDVSMVLSELETLETMG